MRQPLNPMLDQHSKFHQRWLSAELLFRASLLASAGLLLVIVAALLAVLIVAALPSIISGRLGVIAGLTWSPGGQQFGALSLIYGTLVSSILALLIAVPLSIGVAVFLVEQASVRIAALVGFMVELLAAIPSVVYGLWGIFVLAPFVRSTIGPALQTWLGWSPLFRGRITGLGMLTASLVLVLMIVPIITAVVRDILAAVPAAQREAALALGATRLEATRVVLGNCTSAIAGAVALGLGRALGETMAVAMLIGSVAQIRASLFEPAYSISALLANNFAEAVDGIYLSTLMQLCLVLFLVTFAVNGLARLLVWSVTNRMNEQGAGSVI